MTHGGVKQSHYGIKIGAVLSLLATTHGHYCLLAGISFSQSPLSLPFTPSLSAICHLTPKLRPYTFRSLIKCIIKYIFPLFPPDTHIPPPPSSLLSGVLRCSLIRASSIGCHYLSAVSGTLGTVQYCISIGK